jgi:hypothetical protein
VVAHRRVGAEQVREASRFALRLAKLTLRPEWAQWVIRLYRAERMMPSADIFELLESLDVESLLALGPELEALPAERSALAPSTPSQEERATQLRMAALLQLATH